MSAEVIIDQSTSRQIWRGVKSGLPVVVSSAPFSLLFGALAVENGFSVTEAVLASVTIFGGASQMVGVELFGQSVAPWLIVLSIFAVNFRYFLFAGRRRASYWSIPRQIAGFF